MDLIKSEIEGMKIEKKNPSNKCSLKCLLTPPSLDNVICPKFYSEYLKHKRENLIAE